MRAADTNVLVRLIARDDARQVAAAEDFVRPGVWVSLLVLQEAIWVLDRAYQLDRKRQGLVVEMLLEHDCISLESPETVGAALSLFQKKTPRLDFSDCLVLERARRGGHLPVGTFDKKLAKAPDTELLAF